MIELPYSLTIEATEEPDYFGFYSTELEGFSGIGHSIEDNNPKIIIQNEQAAKAA
jgi:hypothetical protein